MPASFCGNCGARLPEENLQQCPYCRTNLLEQRPSNYGFPPHGIPPEGSAFYEGPTVLSSAPPSPLPDKSRSAPPPALPITPSPPPGKARPIIGILIGVIVLLVLSGAIGAFVLTQRLGVTKANSTATAQAQLNATTIAQVQTNTAVKLNATTQTNSTATAQAQANAPVTATATALQNIYIQATGGTPVLSDPLRHQDSNNWDESANCAFVGGTYHASSSLTDNFFTCTPNAHLSNFGDFAFQVQMTIIHGDYGGMFFRANSTGTDYYTFTVDQSGQYSFDVYKNNNHLKTVSNGPSSAFKTGLNQSNLIIVVARGSNFYLYMNGQFVALWSDTSYSAGQIGLLAGDGTRPTEVAFSNLKVWST